MISSLRNILIFLLFTSFIFCGCGENSNSDIPNEEESPKVILKVEKFGKGIVSDDISKMNCSESSCSNEYNVGQRVELSALAENGWRLNKWLGCDSISGNVCTVEMTENKTVFPTFERSTPPSLKKNVVILPPDTISHITSILDGAIIFSSDATDIVSIPIGTILISTVGEGFAKKILDIKYLQGSTITVSTKNVPLAEIINEGTVIFNSQLLEKDLRDVKAPKGLKLRKNLKSNTPSLTFDVDVKVDDGIHVKGAVELQIIPDFALDISLTGIQEFKTAAQFRVKPSLEVSIDKFKELNKEIKLPISMKFTPIVIAPVVLIPEVDVLLRISADAKVSVSMNGFLQVNSRAGLHYKKSVGWKPISELSVNGDFDLLSSYQGEATAEAMIGPKFAVKIYGSVGPWLYVGPYVNGTMFYDVIENCGEWAISGGAKGFVGVSGEVLGWDLGSFERHLFSTRLKLKGDEFGTCTDTQSPSAPGTPLIIYSSPKSLQMKWAPSTDNSSIIKYEVYRDHNKVGETNSPFYFDNGLNSDQQYCYYIIAVDSNNNKSMESGTFCGTTKPDFDDIRPSIPKSLTAKTLSSSAVELSWDNSTDNAGDVSYLVYKLDTGEILAHTKSLSINITRLEPGKAYCFEVAAIDEAGNISEKSNSACTTTKSTGHYRMRVKCQSSSVYVVDINIDMDENIANSVSVVGKANDYDGTPMTYVLTGTYNTDTGQLNGRIDWSFEGHDCSRADTFSVDLASNDSGNILMNQIATCGGCTGHIRFTKASNDSNAKSVRNVIATKPYKETISGN